MASARPTVLAVSSLLICGLIAGCGSAGHHRAERENASLPSRGTPAPSGAGTPVPKLDDSLHQVLPIEAYLISPRQYGDIESAESILVSSCMKRFGFSYTPSVPDLSHKSDQTAHRYDPTDPQRSAERGYHAVLAPSAGAARPAPKLTADMQKVLGHGVGAPSAPGIPALRPGAEYAGVRIPDGGCMGEAERQLTAHGGVVADDEAAEGVNFGDYARSMGDPRVRVVFAKWSACMKDQGFSYPTPRAATNDPRWHTRTPSAREKATAVADARCKQRYNVVGVWFTVESADESGDIRAKARHFAQVRAAILTASANAGRVIRSAGRTP